MLDETNLPAIPAEAPTQVAIDHLPDQQGRMIPDSFQPLGPEGAVQLALDALPNGFFADEDGLYAVEHDDGEVRYHWLCAPLIVEGKAHTISGSDWSTCIRFRDQDGTVVSSTLPDSDILCKVTAIIALLVQQGLKVTCNRKLHAALGQLLMQWKTEKRLTLVDQFGWTDASCTGFILGDGKVAGKANVLPRPHLLSLQGAQPGSKGTLEGWISEISMRAVSNPLMMAAISVSLSGPLLQPLGIEGGGLHIHGASSTGKSTLLRIANSVWTNSNATQSWNGTRNALEHIAAHHSGRLLALDEIGEADPRTIGETAYALTNGRGRSRLTQSLSRNQLSWKLAVVSSGELSLGDHMGSVGKKIMAGQAVRLLSIPIDSEPHGAFRTFHGEVDAAQFAQKTSQSLDGQYGSAGPSFVRKLISYLASDQEGRKLQARHRVIFDQLRKGQEFQEDAITERALRRFALIALAGELGTEFKITGWNAGDAIAAVQEVVRLWGLGRDLPTQTDLNATRNRIAAFVSKNSADLQELVASPQLQPLMAGKKGWKDASTYYFTTEAWSLMHEGHNLTDCAQQVRNRGGLMSNEGGLQYRMPRKIPSRIRVYAVRRSWLEAAAG